MQVAKTFCHSKTLHYSLENNILTYKTIIQMNKNWVFYMLFIMINSNHIIAISQEQNITQTKQKCRQEMERVCPQNRYTTLIEQRQCISANLMVFSNSCQEYLTSKHKIDNYLSQSNSQNSTNTTSNSYDILVQCQTDIERFCETKTKDNQVVAKHKKKCIKTLKQSKSSVLSPVCSQAIDASKGKSQTQQERKELRKQRKINHSQTRATFGSIVMQTPTQTITGYQIPIHQQKQNKAKNKQLSHNSITTNLFNSTTTQPLTTKNNILIPDGTDRLEFEDNGNESGGYIVLSNGREIRQSQMDRFNAKYRDYMDTMSEEGKNILINKYFPNTISDVADLYSDAD